MGFFYRIAIDTIEGNYISGWCFKRFNKQERVQLELHQNGVVLGEMTADIFREDLFELRIHPTGRCGFALVIENHTEFSSRSALHLVEKKTGRLLAEIDNDSIRLKQPARSLELCKKLFSKRSPNKPVVLFMHIPKTAGTSFNTIARSTFPKERAISHIEALAEEKHHDLQNHYHFISGHLRYKSFKNTFHGENTTLYTIVREPFSQLHSHLKWMIESSVERLENSLQVRNPTMYNLGKKLSSIDFSRPQNIQSFIKDIDNIEAAIFDNLQTRYFLDYHVERVSEKDIEQAIANTNYFQLIGLTERYSDFLRKFSELNGIKTPTQVRRLNKSKSKDLFDVDDPLIKNALLPLVIYDLELYEHIRYMNA